MKQYHLNPVTLEQEEVFYLGFPVQHDNNEEETQYHTATFSINQGRFCCFCKYIY